MVTFGHHFKKGGHFSTHPLAAGALPKSESVLDTTFSLYMALCEQVPTAIYNEKSLANARLSNFGWKMGFEPTTFGTTIRHSNRLSYIHHIDPSRNRVQM